MGLTATDIDLLLELKRGKPTTSSIATIGSLSLYLHPAQLHRLKSLIPDSRALSEYRWGDIADPILRDITGAIKVSSIDMSDYQGSSIVHDMNRPLWDSRPDLAGEFDLVIDGGTLEHVFNFPVAVQNMMFLVRQGGHILTANPANNLCGHGFYQFTPELMHRLYAPSNGFRVDHVLLTESRHMSVEMDPHPRSFRVVDPASLGRRILLQNRWPVMIRTLAERIAVQPVAGLDVQQSDYVMAWSGSGRPATRKGPKAWLRKIFHLLPMTTQSRLADILTRNTLSNPQAMRRWRGLIAE
jgi:hypothetical protein